MNKRPSAIKHMITWGVASGTLLVGAFFAFLVGFTGLGSALDIFTLLGRWLSAFAYGSILGAVVGFVGGAILGRMFKPVPMPFTEADMQAQGKLVYPIMLLLPILLALLGFAVFGAAFANLTQVLIPTLIFSVSSVIAAHHYMSRLQIWSKQYDLRKAKEELEAFDMMSLLDKDDGSEQPMPESEASEQSRLES